MSKCSYLPDRVISWCAQSSSISPRFTRGGGVIHYQITVGRVVRWLPLPWVDGKCFPLTLSCPGSVACTVNGVDATPAGSGTWTNPLQAEFADPYNTATSVTYNVVFTLGNLVAGCFAEDGSTSGIWVGALNGPQGWEARYSVNVGDNGPLKLEEDIRNEERQCIPCPCEIGASPQGGTTSGEGPVSYNSANASSPPSSMGWGWSLPGLNRYVVEETPGGDVIYYDGSGSFERWQYASGTYTARYNDNYATLTRPGGSGNPFKITLKDKTELNFRLSDGKLSTEVDRNGNTKTYSYDTGGKLVSVSDGEGRVLYLDYGSRTDGQPVALRQQDASTGRLTTFDYHTNGRLWKVTDPEGEVWEYLYNSDNLLWKDIDPRGKVAVERTYSSGKLASQILYGERKLSYAYSAGPESGYIVEVTEEDLTLSPNTDPRVSTYTYDKRSNLVRKVDPLGNIWEYRYEDKVNPYLMTQVIDPNGHTTDYDHDSMGNLTSVTDAQGNTTTVTYTQGYLPVEIQRPAVTVDGVVQTYPPTELGYDSNGNLTTLTEVLNGNNLVTTLTYDAQGRVATKTNRLGQVVQYQYTTQSTGQNKGNLKKIILPAGPNGAPSREIQFSYNHYDEVTRVTDAGGNEVDYQLDDNGRIVKLIDPLNQEVDYHYLDGLLDYIELPANQGSSSNRRRTRFTHDDVGRVLQVLSKVAASSEQMRVRHEYDGRSNLKKLIRLRNSLEKTYQFSYDALNRPTQLQDPLAAVRAVAYDPHCRNYTATSARGLETMVKRDSRCQVTEIVNADEKREFDYDEWGRLITVTTTQNPLSRYVDPNNPPTDHPRARYGQVRYGPPATPQVTRYLYDALSRLVKITYPDNQIVEYAYNAEGQLIEVTDMLGQKTQYSYYNDGRLYQVTVVATPSNQVFTYLYDAAGRVSEIQYPTATGVVAKFSDASNNSGWDANGRLLHLRYLQAGNLLQGYQYSYDASGNRTQMVEQPGSGPSITWDYGYDWLDRLISVKKDTVTQSLYAYDESDNRVELQWPVLSQTHAYAYDDANRLTSRTLNGSTAETFSHDADGNMIARTAGGQTTHYRWDAFDKLIRRESASLTQSYGYDVEGLRKSTGTNTKNYHSGGVSLADQRPSGSISFLQGHQILGMKQDGAFYWYLPDHLGTVRQVIDNSGTVVATTSLDEFGRELSSSGSADRRLHTYTGSLGVRQEDGLYLAGQRWFDPSLGRWLNPDPIGFAGGLNLFVGMSNSPINHADPSGLDIWLRQKTQPVIGNRGGYGYDYEWRHYDDARAAAPYINRARPGDVIEAVFQGHQSQGGQTVGGSGYIINENGRWRLKQGHDVDIDLARLKELGVQHIELRSCNSAGGSRDSKKGKKSRQAAERFARERGSRFGEATFPPPTDDNFAHRVARDLGVDVSGSTGLWWFDGFNGDVPPAAGSHPLNERLIRYPGGQ